ncbi:MAG: protein TolQ [Xanthomonadaceae bacterium]|nr:protein TolQ [Xanthomonadaceae bacterium]
MSTDMSLIALVLEASLLVQLVMLLLLLASVASWAVILQKRKLLGDISSATEAFEERFWSGTELSTLYQEITARDEKKLSGIERMFEAGFREFVRLRKQRGIPPADVVKGAERAMHITQVREVDRLEEHLPFLATVGSTSPYVGLFGTVWGIMNSFRALGNVQHATLAMVAPGIAEALIATAMGLFAAIPAVIAYNRYANQVERLETRWDTFADEFSSILQRHAHAEA